MALIAPFTNAMRLGQGFNSYTQQICLDKAVVIPRPKPKQISDVQNSVAGADLPPPSNELNVAIDQSLENRTVKRAYQGQSQIVTYSAKFIDKLSDITDALNVSASLSIKTAQIGGSVKGSYVDTDKFKSSDLNFTIQVKVINQRLESEEYSEFNSILEPSEMRQWKPSEFTSIYGDTFISGWETGGELNALISVKVLDKSKVNQIKGELEGSLGTPALSAQITGGVDKEKSSLETNTETTVSVNWSGGGKIKDDNVLWNVESLTLAAANFPDRVAETPQKTYAILTQYTKLFDYQRKMAGGRCSPLVYENANIYTSALLDSFMDYKALWKQIQIAMYEVEQKNAKAYKAIPSSRTTAFLASIKSTPQLPQGEPPSNQNVLENGDDSHSEDTHTSPDIIPSAKTAVDGVGTKNVGSWPKYNSTFVPNILDLSPYEPDVIGLDKARRDCRFEMTKIVNEASVRNPRKQQQY